MTRRTVLSAALRLVVAAVVPILLGAPLGLSGAAAFERQTLEIATKTGVHVFSVEVATTDAERAQGLMHRKELPEGTGMLFDFKRDEPVAMWMKNTYVSLDMIFITADGRIHRIAENTTPMSERIIPSGGPVRGVLEVVAGTAKKLGIAPGDRIGHPMFSGR
ncbi:hypothetical protein CCR97_09060 [Rhodoplanes elegans]|uniref:DUF192 domain-containing protein n=1 Tax=Rhodoplanes elegans TaxID=29408 RepID=A0A327KMS3_9BRAD|nr:DUF192 domain-containing protein [Rhodoplanes elegans]MBK5958360.1 hypothetical protein [Rhodoplanes elegans]RAI39747.1 hypothetical protein CH338_08480 [Rhodoplanes elegans]